MRYGLWKPKMKSKPERASDWMKGKKEKHGGAALLTAQRTASAWERTTSISKARNAIPTLLWSKQIFSCPTTSQFACAKRRVENEHNFWVCHTTLSGGIGNVYAYSGLPTATAASVGWNICKIDRRENFSSSVSCWQKVILLKKATGSLWKKILGDKIRSTILT